MAICLIDLGQSYLICKTRNLGHDPRITLWNPKVVIVNFFFKTMLFLII